MKKASKAEVDQTSALISKAGPSKQAIPTIHPITQSSNHSDAQPIEMDFYGPSLPPRFTQSVQSDYGSQHSGPKSDHLGRPQRVHSSKAKTHSDKKKHNVQAKCYS